MEGQHGWSSYVTKVKRTPIYFVIQWRWSLSNIILNSQHRVFTYVYHRLFKLKSLVNSCLSGMVPIIEVTSLGCVEVLVMIYLTSLLISFSSATYNVWVLFNFHARMLIFTIYTISLPARTSCRFRKSPPLLGLGVSFVFFLFIFISILQPSCCNHFNYKGLKKKKKEIDIYFPYQIMIWDYYVICLIEKTMTSICW